MINPSTQLTSPAHQLLHREGARPTFLVSAFHSRFVLPLPNFYTPRSSASNHSRIMARKFLLLYPLIESGIVDLQASVLLMPIQCRFPILLLKSEEAKAGLGGTTRAS